VAFFVAFDSLGQGFTFLALSFMLLQHFKCQVSVQLFLPFKLLLCPHSGQILTFGQLLPFLAISRFEIGLVPEAVGAAMARAWRSRSARYNLVTGKLVHICLA